MHDGVGRTAESGSEGGEMQLTDQANHVDGCKARTAGGGGGGRRQHRNNMVAVRKRHNYKKIIMVGSSSPTSPR